MQVDGTLVAYRSLCGVSHRQIMLWSHSAPSGSARSCHPTRSPERIIALDGEADLNLRTPALFDDRDISTTRRTTRLDRPMGS